MSASSAVWSASSRRWPGPGTTPGRRRELYRKAELEAKKCGALERKISALKQSRAKLGKRQRHKRQ